MKYILLQDKDARHTILLHQLEPSKASRRFEDFSRISHALKWICELFENKLRELNPHASQVSYEVQDLWNYLDKVPDISALVYDPKINAYIPCGKEWLKKKVLAYIQDVNTRRR